MGQRLLRMKGKCGRREFEILKGKNVGGQRKYCVKHLRSHGS